MRMFLSLLVVLIIHSTSSFAAETKSDDLPDSQNDKKLIELYKKRALTGDSFSQYRLGYFYEHGRGVEKDVHKALEWYEKAAAKNDSRAIFNLAVMYFYGNGIPQDVEKGMSLFEKSFQLHSWSAAEALGRIYLYGDNVPKDLPKSVEYLKIAAKVGRPNSLYLLSLMNLRGIGMEQNEEEGILLLIEAARNGSVEARNDIEKFEKRLGQTLQSRLKEKYNYTDPPYVWKTD